MKTLIKLTAILIFILGCTKEPDCYVCTTTSSENSIVFTICDKTPEEIRGIEGEGIDTGTGEPYNRICKMDRAR